MSVLFRWNAGERYRSWIAIFPVVTDFLPLPPTFFFHPDSPPPPHPRTHPALPPSPLNRVEFADWLEGARGWGEEGTEGTTTDLLTRLRSSVSVSLTSCVLVFSWQRCVCLWTLSHCHHSDRPPAWTVSWVCSSLQGVCFCSRLLFLLHTKVIFSDYRWDF